MWGLMTAAHHHYRQLFGRLEADIGPVASETISSIVGFSAGGPVSMRRVGVHHAYVTCELSLYPQQKVSSQGHRYELFTRALSSEPQAQSLLTALGNLSMAATLGHRHTVDVSGVSGAGGLTLVWLKHYSSASIDATTFDVYEVVAGTPTED